MGLCGGGCQRGWIEDELGVDASKREEGYKREYAGVVLCVYRLMIVVVPLIAKLVEMQKSQRDQCAPVFVAVITYVICTAI
jgi:hypothetical protein